MRQPYQPDTIDDEEAEALDYEPARALRSRTTARLARVAETEARSHVAELAATYRSFVRTAVAASGKPASLPRLDVTR